MSDCIYITIEELRQDKCLGLGTLNTDNNGNPILNDYVIPDSVIQALIDEAKLIIETYLCWEDGLCLQQYSECVRADGRCTSVFLPHYRRFRHWRTFFLNVLSVSNQCGKCSELQAIPDCDFDIQCDTGILDVNFCTNNCTSSCGCNSKCQLTVVYEAGFSPIPEVIKLAMIKIISGLTQLSCASDKDCGSCDVDTAKPISEFITKGRSLNTSWEAYIPEVRESAINVTNSVIKDWLGSSLDRYSLCFKKGVVSA